MAIKVHGSAFSPATLRALASLTEKGLEFQLVQVNLAAGEQKEDPFLSLNPFGQVPGFEDGDLKLFESRAIVQYVNNAYKARGTQLTLEDPKKQGLVFVWMEVEAQDFDPVAGKLAFELALKPIFGMITDDAAVAGYEAKLGPILDVYEARLSGSKYLGGDVFTLADLYHLPALHFLQGTKAKAHFDARPHVRAWVANILGRPAWAKVIALQKQK